MTRSDKLLSGLKSIFRLRLIRQLRMEIFGLVEDFRWYCPGPGRAVKNLKLELVQIYPNGKNFKSLIRKILLDKLEALKIDYKTSIVSIGSCFAEEFTRHILHTNYKYIFTESGATLSSANWGRVYTIPNLLQVVRYSFEDDFPLFVERSDQYFYDPTREPSVASFRSPEDTLNAIRNHRRASREAFIRAELLVITIGQNEAWMNKNSGLIHAHVPRINRKIKCDAFLEHVNFSLEENLSSFSRALDLLFEHNPGTKILLTVSPVPAFAIWGSSDVISSSFLGKCTLRYVVDQMVQKYPGKVYYFPSMEMVLGLNRDAFCADNRHVKPARVDFIFDTLFNVIEKNKSA